MPSYQSKTPFGESKGRFMVLEFAFEESAFLNLLNSFQDLVTLFWLVMKPNAQEQVVHEAQKVLSLHQP